MSRALPSWVTRTVLDRQTAPQDGTPTCPITGQLLINAPKWDRGNFAHIVPHAVWDAIGRGSKAVELFANPNNIIFVDENIHRNLEAWDTIPSFSFKHLEQAQPPPGFPNDAVYEVTYSRRRELLDHPVRSLVANGKLIHLHRDTVPFVKIHYMFFCAVDCKPKSNIWQECVQNLCVQYMSRALLEKVVPVSDLCTFHPPAAGSSKRAMLGKSKPQKHVEKLDREAARGYIGRTFNLRATKAFKHTCGKRPNTYLAHVIASNHSLEVVYVQDYAKEDLVAFMRTYKGRVRRGQLVQVHTYSIDEFHSMFSSEAITPEFLKGLCNSHSSEHDAGNAVFNGDLVLAEVTPNAADLSSRSMTSSPIPTSRSGSLSPDVPSQNPFMSRCAKIKLSSTTSPPAAPKGKRLRNANGGATFFDMAIHCTNTHCTYLPGHDGLCSHMKVAGRRTLCLAPRAAD